MFLYNSNEQFQKEIKKTIPFAKAFRAFELDTRAIILLWHGNNLFLMVTCLRHCISTFNFSCILVHLILKSSRANRFDGDASIDFTGCA